MKKIFACILMFTLFSSFSTDSPENQLKQFVSNNLPQITGWCSQEKALNFVDLVLEVKPQVCVDIGTFGGSSLFPVALTLKFLNQGVVIAIDPWDKNENLKQFDPLADPVNTQWWSKIDFAAVYASYNKMINKYGLADFCETLKMTSEQAVNQIEHIDILYIDGGHSEAGFTTDVLLYLPKVRHGGYIWLNDTLWEQAQYAIELLLQQCEVVKLIDNGNCILFKKI